MNLAFYRYLWEFYTSGKFGWIQSVSFQVEEHPSNTPHQHLLYETDLLHNLGYNVSNFNSTFYKFSFTSVFFFPIVDNEICFPLLLMYSILLSFPFTCSFIVLFLLLSMMDMLYLTPSVFGWFFFPTENDTYHPAYSIFFSMFFNTLNCYQPTCIYTHFSSTKICKSAVWREKKKRDTYQTEDWTKIWGSIVCRKYSIWKKMCFFAFVHMLLAAEKRYHDGSLIRLLLLHLDWALL